jgi:hypothetical protein
MYSLLFYGILNCAFPFIRLLRLYGRLLGAHSSVVVEALCFKLKGHTFKTQGSNLILSINLILLVALDPADRWWLLSRYSSLTD